MRKRLILLIFVIVCFSQHAFSQEFICQVSINTSKVQASDKHKYETLQKALYEFVNNRKWTNYQYKNEERIECSILFTLDDPGTSDELKGTCNLQLRRPVFKTAYNTVLFNYIDKDIQFTYTENEPLDFVENTFISNLTSMVSFYLNIFLALDADAYSMKGGGEFLTKANAIVNTCQNRAEKGWKAFESQRNRFWLVENIQNGAYSKVREFWYKYHRLGLDVMADNLEGGRQAITESLELLQMLNREKPGLFIISIIVQAKSDEIINIYSKASPQDKSKVTGIMRELDPANASKYQVIMTSK
jgi:hypothetical protein